MRNVQRKATRAMNTLADSIKLIRRTHHPQSVALLVADQLVELVAEMRMGLRCSIGGSVGIEQLGNQRIIDDALTKADALLSGLKE